MVAFGSHATNLVTGVSGLDGNFSDLYARNLVTGEDQGGPRRGPSDARYTVDDEDGD